MLLANPAWKVAIHVLHYHPIQLVLGECNGNVIDAVGRYREKHSRDIGFSDFVHRPDFS
jgi:hypothetical protein